MQKKAFTLEELAVYTNSQLIGNPNHKITGIADLESADIEDASFLANPKYEKAMQQSSAGVVFISPQTSQVEGRNYLVTANPSRAFQQTVEAFWDPIQDISGFEGIHPTAVVHPTADIGKNVTLGPHAVIDKNVKIGDQTVIGANCYIGPFTSIGNECFFYPQVTVRERSQIGSRVILQPGVVIGACGFGFTTDSKGRHTKLNQVGIVIVEDDVEIGANTTIDRSRFKATIIRRGTKIDNLVQIGHGVIVGQDNLIVSQTGIAGSSVLGNHVILAGQTAVAGHLSITDGVIISARTGVSKSINKPGKYGGVPAMPMSDYNRNCVYLRNIETYVEIIKKLQQRLEALEKKSFTADLEE